MKRMKFTGSGWEMTGMNILLSVGTFCTFGLLFPYQIMWNVKFFIEHTELTK